MSAALCKAVTSASKGSSTSQCLLKCVGRVRNLLFERGSLCCLLRHKHFLSRDVDTNGGLNDNASRMRVTEEGIVLMIFFLDHIMAEDHSMPCGIVMGDRNLRLTLRLLLLSLGAFGFGGRHLGIQQLVFQLAHFLLRPNAKLLYEVYQFLAVGAVCLLNLN